jgi:hypothetical protein
MAAIPAWVIAVAGTAVSAASSYSASKQQEINEKAAAEANARRAAAAAKEAEAAGQLKASEARRKAEIMASRALAVAAASGAGTSGIETLFAGLAEEGEREAGTAKYEAIETSKGLQDRAAIAKYNAEASGNARKVERSANLMGSMAQGASIYSKYGSSPNAKTT